MENLGLSDEMREENTQLENKWDVFKRSLFFSESKQISFMASGIILSNVLSFLMMTTSVIFVGHMGKAEMAAASLATSYSWVTMFLSVGMQFGMDSLIPQAIGAKNNKMIGIVLQTSLLCSVVSCIPVGILWWFGDHIIRLWVPHNDPLLPLFSQFNKLLLPGLIPFSLFSALKNYCENQQLVKPGIVVSFVGFVVNVFFNWLYIYGIGLGFTGAPLATASSNIVLLGTISIYIYYTDLYKPHWSGWTKEAFNRKNLWAYLKFALPASLMATFEVGGFEVMTLMTGKFGDVVISAHTIAFNVLITLYMFPWGFSRGTSTRVGTYLGNGNPSTAKKVAYIGTFLTVSCMLINITLVSTTRKYIGLIFTKEKEIIHLASKLLLIMCLVTFFDGFNATLAGILRGVGRPYAGTIIGFFGFWMIGFPMGLVFGFVLKKGVFGFWWALLCGLGFIVIVEFIYLFSFNWEALAKEAQERTRDDSEGSSEKDFDPFAQPLDVVNDDVEMNIPQTNQLVVNDENKEKYN